MNEDQQARAMAVIYDIYAHLNKGMVIKPDNRSVLNGPGQHPGAPTITEYLEGLLEEMGYIK